MIQSKKNGFHQDKMEAMKQWECDPCGFSAVKNMEPLTKEFYERVDYNRYKEYAPWIKEVAGFKRYKNKKVLEVGFGMGTDLFQFALAGNEVYGVDLAPKHLEIARKRFTLYDMKANLLLGDAESLIFPSDTFDVVYSFGVIHHTPNTQKAIDEIYRVLKKGGVAIIGVYHKNSIYFWFTVTLYLILGWFCGKSTRRILASLIEYQENSDACPLVKMYTKKEFTAMTRDFFQVQLATDHLVREHFALLFPFVNQWLVEKLRIKFGWYLIAHCIK